MDEREFKRRTYRFGLSILALVDELPKTAAGRAVAGQLARSGTSVGANYRSACRARSSADMLSKLGIVEEEADESGYWLELIIESHMLPSSRIEPLLRESNEILAMTVSSLRTLRGLAPGEISGNLKSKI